MQGGTVFDRGTWSGGGGATTVGSRAHPPYNAEWEAIYARHVTKTIKNMPPGTRVFDYGCAENNRNPVYVDTGQMPLLGSFPAIAHHSRAGFDADVVKEVSGIVWEF